eukprot:scaffold109881_cov55-Cyclotella_meneghiniana.AAC.4
MDYPQQLVEMINILLEHFTQTGDVQTRRPRSTSSYANSDHCSSRVVTTQSPTSCDVILFILTRHIGFALYANPVMPLADSTEFGSRFKIIIVQRNSILF